MSHITPAPLREAQRLAKRQPASSEITSAPKAGWIDKRFGQQDRVTVVAFPILTEALTVEGQDSRRDIPTAPLRQHEETSIVGKEMKAAEAERGAPADPGITRSTLQGGRTPAQ
jgi:hypothetical protein